MKLVPRDAWYPCPGVHGDKVRLSAADLLDFLEDLQAVQPRAVQRQWSLGVLLENSSIKKGEILRCCLVTRLPTAKWHASCDRMRGYITVTGRRGQRPFAMHHRGIGFCLPAPPPEFLTAPHTRFKRSSRRDRPTKSSIDPDIFDCSPTPPPSPASRVGNKPYSVHLHKWAALACGPSINTSVGGLVGLHCCGRKNCICMAHFQLGTHAQNTRDAELHTQHPGVACRSYPTR